MTGPKLNEKSFVAGERSGTKASAMYIRSSAWKARVVLNLIRDLPVDAVIRRMVRCGILRRRSPSRYEFPFPIIQEYLAATELLQVGADDLLDKYPTPTQPAANTTGALGFSRYSPFGFSGRYLYGRLGYRW